MSKDLRTRVVELETALERALPFVHYAAAHAPDPVRAREVLALAEAALAPAEPQRTTAPHRVSVSSVFGAEYTGQSSVKPGEDPYKAPAGVIFGAQDRDSLAEQLYEWYAKSDTVEWDKLSASTKQYSYAEADEIIAGRKKAPWQVPR